MSVKHGPAKRWQAALGRRIGLCLALLGLELTWAQTIPDNAYPAHSRLSGLVSRVPMVPDPLGVTPPVMRLGPQVMPSMPAICTEPQLATRSPLNLQQALDLALCRSPAVQKAWGQMQSAVGEAGLSQSAYWPQIVVQNGRQRTQEQSPLNEQDLRGMTRQVGLNWRLWDNGTRYAIRYAASDSLRASMVGFDVAVVETLVLLTDAYHTTWSNQLQAEQNRENEHQLKELVALLERKQRAGLASQYEIQTARLRLQRQELLTTKSESEARRSEAVLRTLLRWPGSQPLIWPDLPEPSWLQETLPGLEEVLERLRGHPALEAIEWRISAAQWRSRAEAANRGPTVELAAVRQINGTPNLSYIPDRRVHNVNVNFQWTLFEGFASQYRLARTQGEITEAEADWLRTWNELSQSATQMRVDLVIYRDRGKQAKDLLETIQQQDQLLMRLQQQGAAERDSILENRIARAEARLSWIEASVLWRAAQLKLSALVGPEVFLSLPSHSATKGVSP